MEVEVFYDEKDPFSYCWKRSMLMFVSFSR